MTSICDLPNEILLKILGYLSMRGQPSRVVPRISNGIESAIPYYAADSGLLGACRVNKRFNGLATPILYHHVIIGSFDLYSESSQRHRSVINYPVIASLMIPDHSARVYIRHLSVRPRLIRRGREPVSSLLSRKSRVILIFLLWLLEPNQLCSLDIGDSGVLPGWIKFNKLKSLAYPNRWSFSSEPWQNSTQREPYSSLLINSIIKTKSFGQIDSIEHLKFQFELFHGWGDLLRAAKKLKCLVLRQLTAPRRHGAAPVAPLTVAKGPEELLQLEVFHVAFASPVSSLERIFPSELHQFIEVSCLQTICLEYSFNLNKALLAAAPTLQSLRSLALSQSCTVDMLNQLLYCLPRPLESLVYRHASGSYMRFVQKGAMIRHRKTLRRLSLNIFKGRTLLELPRGNLDISTVDRAGLPSTYPEEQFSLTDLITFSELEEVAVPICHLDIFMLTQLPKLRALSIPSHYYHFQPRSIAPYPQQFNNIWLLIHHWAKKIDKLTNGGEGRGQACLPRIDAMEIDSIVSPRISNPFRLKGLKIRCFYKTHVACSARDEYFILRKELDRSGCPVEKVRRVEGYEFAREFPDIRVFDAWNERRGFFWDYF